MSEIVTDVAIVGGGMAGMTLGLALAGASVRAVVVDRLDGSAVTDSRYDGRASAIAHASANIFKVTGIWDRLKDEASPIYDIRVADGHPLRGISPLFLHYDHREIGDLPFGYIIENRAIRQALHECAASCGTLDVIRPAEVSAVRRDGAGAEIELADGRRISAALAVAADGRNSWLRRDAGIRISDHRYRQKSIVCTVRHERDHRGVAVELFLPSGPFAMLPMTDRRSNVVWTERADLADRYLELGDDAFLNELQARFGDWLGGVSLTGPRFGFPLGVLHAARYTDRRLALVGDAAHAIHPIAGQGLNLGLRDIAALAELIVDARRLGLDIGADTVLNRYGRWRRVDNTILIAVTDGLNRLFSNDFPIVRGVRDAGLAGVGKLPALKRFFMRHAMGHVGDRPRLIQGLPL